MLTRNRYFMHSFRSLSGRGKVSEENNPRSPAQSVRHAGMGAARGSDVNFQVVKELATGRREAIGQHVITPSSPCSLMVNMLYDDALIEALVPSTRASTRPARPTCHHMCGLQGSGRPRPSASSAMYLTSQRASPDARRGGFAASPPPSSSRVIANSSSFPSTPIKSKCTPLDEGRRAGQPLQWARARSAKPRSR